jgi:Winged helix DNA-binding domain
MPDTHAKQELALLRLVAQGIIGSRPTSPARVVQRLLCLQAQDYWSGIASVAVRSATSLTEVAAALNAGTVVRAWPLRGTLHLVAAADLGWLRTLLAPRQLAAAAAREARLGIDAHVLDRAQHIAVEVISSRGPASRSEITAAWRAVGIDTANQRGYHLIWHLAHTGILCLGPVHQGQQLLVLAEKWVPPSAGLGRDDALKALAHRYFASHGPATPADLARWANLTTADTKRAIAAARPGLTNITVASTEYLLDPAIQDELAARRDEAEGVIALPGFDELIFGYHDRTPTLSDDHSVSVFPYRNGIPRSTIVLDGQVVATWKRPTQNRARTVEITPLTSLSGRVIRLASQKAAVLVQAPHYD